VPSPYPADRGQAALPARAPDTLTRSRASRWPVLEARPLAGRSAKLIDTRLVCAELTRLRALAPGTELPRAAAVRSTIAGGS
jgi:hypothetical protein